MNVVNDYFDCLNNSDNINRSGLTPFTGGSRFIQNGLMTQGETLALGISLLFAGSAIGVYLAYKTSYLLLLIGLIGLFTGFFYSAPPLFLAGRGLGEITVGADFGILTVLGSYLVQTGTVSLEAFIASLPLSFFIAGLLYINQFPDFEADKTVGKRNIVVRLGLRRGRWGIILITAGAYLSIVAGVILRILPPFSLIALLSVFFSFHAAKGLIINYNGGKALIPSIKQIILAHLSTGLLLVISNLL
jgi:1,4-dihydroxy-2-naphthoate octaprenyltransferase